MRLLLRENGLDRKRPSKLGQTSTALPHELVWKHAAFDSAHPSIDGTCSAIGRDLEATKRNLGKDGRMSLAAQSSASCSRCSRRAEGLPSQKAAPSPSRKHDGQGYNVLRVLDGSLELGAIRNIREGAPILGDVVSLSQRNEHERLFNVETLVKSPRPPEPARHGPAQVATEKYRSRDLTFGPHGPSAARTSSGKTCAFWHENRSAA